MHKMKEAVPRGAASLLEENISSLFSSVRSLRWPQQIESGQQSPSQLVPHTGWTIPSLIHSRASLYLLSSK